MGLNCTAAINTNAVICGNGMYTCRYSAGQMVCGKTAKCVKPTISYILPSGWTNEDITITYSGTQSGSIIFEENGMKSIIAMSSTGHRIREDITISRIDKTV